MIVMSRLTDHSIDGKKKIGEKQEILDLIGK